MLVIRVSKAALALTHDIDGTFLMFCHIPRWSSGQDFALSPRRPGFDSPSGKTFLLDVCSHNAIDFRRHAGNQWRNYDGLLFVLFVFKF